MSVSRHWYVAATRACRADHCEVWQTTSSSSRVACACYSTCQLRHVVAWRRPVLPCRSLRSGGSRIGRPGHQHSDPGENGHEMPWATRCHGRWFVQFLHVHALVHLQIAAIDVEHVPRRSRRGLCRLTVDYGNRGHCAKLDKPITVLYIAHTVSSGARDVAAERRFLDIIWWHLMLPHPSLLPSSFCTLLAATYVN